MGGVGVSQPQYWFLNNQNPALLIYNSLTVFQIGILVENKTIRQDTLTEKSSGGNLAYLATAFPIKFNRWTTSVGLAPYSSVNYQVNYYDLVQNSASDSIFVTEKGTGGLTELYWANGVRLAKNLSVGLRASYFFSSIKNTYSNQLIKFGFPSSDKITVEEKSIIKDFGFTAGVAYGIDSLFAKNRYRVNFGATYSLQNDLNSTLRREQYREATSGQPTTDTLSSVGGATRIPAAITAGVSLGYTGRWTIGTDFHFQDWSTYKSVNQTNESLGKSWRISFGGELTPDLYSGNYLKRMTYRAGANFEQTPFLVNTNDDLTAAPNYVPVKDLGINFGLSMPAGSSTIDLAFKFGKRGNKAETVLEESYFRIFFGITFNDRWFVRRRFD